MSVRTSARITTKFMAIETCSVKTKIAMVKSSANLASINQTSANQAIVLIGVELAHDHFVAVTPDIATRSYQ